MKCRLIISGSKFIHRNASAMNITTFSQAGILSAARRGEPYQVRGDGPFKQKLRTTRFPLRTLTSNTFFFLFHVNVIGFMHIFTI